MPSTRLGDCVPYLMDAFVDTREHYETDHPGHGVLVTCTYRPPEEQMALYLIGRDPKHPGKVVTTFDGVTSFSKHNAYPSKALDVAILVGGKVSWALADYEAFGLLAETRRLAWGGRFKALVDGPHIETID